MIVDSFTKVMVSMFMAILIVIFTGLYTYSVPIMIT